MFKVFLDGAKDPVVECHSYGSRDVEGHLHLIADGALFPVTGKMIVCQGDALGDGTLNVADVLEPNDVVLARRLKADAERAAREAADAERMAAEKRSLK